MIVSAIVLALLLFMYILSAMSRQRKPIHMVRVLPEYSEDVPMVHSRSPNLTDYIAPMDYYEKDTVKQLCIDNLQWELSRETDQLLHFEVYSNMWRFVDDVHLEFDPLSKQIYLSSRSRIGKVDFGANRKRLEQLRAVLQQYATPITREDN